MPAILMFLAAVVTAGEPASPPQATPAVAQAAETKARERATYESILAALKHKRAEVAQSPLPAGVHADSRRYALDFLDRQIAKIKAEMER